MVFIKSSFSNFKKFRNILCISLVIMISVSFIPNPKKIHAEPITASVSLIYFVAASISAGVIYSSVSDMELAYKGYDKSLSTSDRLAFANVARIAITNELNGVRESFMDSNLLNYILDMYDNSKTSYFLDENFDKYYNGNGFRKYKSLSVYRKGDRVSYSANGHVLEFVYADDGLRYFYYDGVQVAKVALSGYGINKFVYENGKITLGLESSTHYITNYTAREADDVEFIPSDAQVVNYRVASNSRVANGSPVGLTALPGLPYVPGLNTLDDLGNLTFPGTVEDLVNALDTNRDFAGRILDGLVNQDVDSLSDSPVHNPVITDDGVTYGNPAIPGNPAVPGNPAIPGVPVVDVPDLPVVDVPGFGWLVDILTSLYNLIRSLFNVINSFLSNLIKALLDLLKSLFIPSADLINSYAAAMELSLKNKWGNNLYSSLFDKVKSLKGVPIPDLYIKNNKVLDASYINSFADVVRSWQRWFYYILIALYNLNGIYKLIRNGEMIGRSGGAKK